MLAFKFQKIKISSEMARRDAQIQRTLAENVRLKRIVRGLENQIDRARIDTQNATRLMNQTIESSNVKVVACTAMSKFILPRMNNLDFIITRGNICVVCYNKCNVQLGKMEGCGHKLCNECLLRTLDFSNQHNDGRCPECRTPIVNIIDAEYDPDDDPDNFADHHVGLIRYLFCTIKYATI